MFLFDNIVEGYDLVYRNRVGAVRVDIVNRRLVGAASSIATLTVSPFAPIALSKKLRSQLHRA